MNVNYAYFAPEIVISVTALVILFAGLFKWKEDHVKLSLISVAGLLVALFYTFILKETYGTTLSGNVLTDQYAVFFKVIFIMTLIGIIIISQDYFKELNVLPSEYLVLLLFAGVGMMIMVTTSDLLVLFLGVEITSLSSYVLTGYSKKNNKSNEAAIKYLVLGIIASAIMLYGLSFIYGITGETEMTNIRAALIGKNKAVLTVGLVMLIAAFSFKFAAAPFHQWVPDVYEGAPTPITAFLSTGSKMAAIAAFIRLTYMCFPDFANYWKPIVLILSVFSMFIGNLFAIWQKNIKRMLAYSSIAHVGYILVGVYLATKLSMTGVLFYSVIYVIMNIGAFAVVIAVARGKMLEDLDNYRGLSKRAPVLAFSMALIMVSLIGLPPTSGLWGKFYIFAEAINQGIYWLAIVGLINSVISMYYYANVIRHMYILEPVNGETESPIEISNPIRSVVVVSSVLIILLGLFPQILTVLSRYSAITGGS